ncbi:hypothetical protein [Baekduia sp. Peel2402]|uniref:hypothetical protein n=1 Tax=Baekduia sp. Peel2402 TaxID=3458296 RepID=UPI00403EE48C
MSVAAPARSEAARRAAARWRGLAPERVEAVLARVPLAAWTVVLAGVLRLVYGAPVAGYDAWWSLAWGRELAHGVLPNLEGAWAPTPHPLAIAVAAPVSALGDAAPDALGWISLLALAAVATTAALLGGRLFGPLAGALAAAILVTRPLLVGAALEGSADVPFLALVLGAGAALAAGRDRRALVLLLAAGLLRPEAWALALALAAWRRTPLTFVFALAAPVAWLLFDLACTGDPLHSLHGTRELADGLGRPQSLATALRVAPDYLTVVLGDGVALLGGAAAIGAVWLAPRRAALPLATLGAGLAGFLVLGITGLPLLYRYTLLPAAALALLAAYGTQQALRTRRTLPLALIGLTVIAAALVTARAPIERHASHARQARAEQRDLITLLHATDDAIARCGVHVTRQRAAPQVAFTTGHAPRGAGGVLLVPNPGSAAFADRLAPTDDAGLPPAARPLDARGAWTALSTC